MTCHRCISGQRLHASTLQAVRGQHNKVSAEEAIAAIKRQGDDDADALSAQDEAVIAQLFSQRATQVGPATLRDALCYACCHCLSMPPPNQTTIMERTAGSLHQSGGMRSMLGACLVVVGLSSAWSCRLSFHCCFR